MKIPQNIINTLNEIPEHVIQAIKNEGAYDTFGCVEGIQKQIDAGITAAPVFLVYYAKYIPTCTQIAPSGWCINSQVIDTMDLLKTE